MIDSDEEVVNRYRYSPFGESIIKNETVYNPYQYTGRRYDEESGLYYYRARMYSPEMSCFTSNDVSEFQWNSKYRWNCSAIPIDPTQQGENWYVYVGNDPTNNRDPSGKYIPMSIFDPRPFIPYMEHGVKQYAYYPTSELGLEFMEYRGRQGYDMGQLLPKYIRELPYPSVETPSTDSSTDLSYQGHPNRDYQNCLDVCYIEYENCIDTQHAHGYNCQKVWQNCNKQCSRIIDDSDDGSEPYIFIIFWWV